MARQDLSIIYTKAKRDFEIAFVQLRQKHSLPAYLMAGIVEGLLAEINKECVLELSATTDAYMDAVENEKKEEINNASDES